MLSINRRNHCAPFLHMFFMEIFVIAAWEIWNVWNSKIFEGTTPTLHLWVFKFKEQTSLQMHRVR